MKGLPLEPKILIKNPGERRRIVSPSCTVNDSRDGVCFTNERSEEERSKFSYRSTKHVKKHASVHYVDDVEQEDNRDVTVIYVRDKEPEHMLSRKIQRRHNVKSSATEIDQKQKVKTTFTDLEYATETELNSANILNNLDIESTHALEHNTSVEDDHGSKPGDVVSEYENVTCTANKFLNELYNKKLDLECNFTPQEIEDIRAAVHQQVTLIANKLGEIDARLSIQEVIPVGSAREDTQIIRPCEYDYILVLEKLSKPMAVSLEPVYPKSSKNKKFMNVKLEDNDVRSMFQEISEDNYIRGSHWLPCFRRGLREVFCSAVHLTICLNSKVPITTSTGKLNIRQPKPESHGPAFMLGLVWERETTKKTIEISIDLCPALKLDRILHGMILPPFRLINNNISSNVVGILARVWKRKSTKKTSDRIESVLLIPCEGHLFKLTITETELLLTSYLSPHHLKCYKLLKYLVNGEPFPRERHANRIIRPFLDSKTIFHSYRLKQMVWSHQIEFQCTEKTDLCSCINNILCALEKREDYANFNCRKCKRQLSIWRLRTLQEGIKRITSTPIKEYKFETCRGIIKFHGLQKCPAGTFAQILYVLFLVMVLIGAVVSSFTTRAINNKAVLALAVIVVLFDIVSIIFNIVSVLYLRSSLCTNTVMLRFYFIYIFLNFLYEIVALVSYFSILNKERNYTLFS